MELAAAREGLKGTLAELLSLRVEDSSCFAFVPNTTSGLQAIAHALPWRTGDRVLLFKGEFPTNVTPWLQAAQRHDLEVCWADLAPLSAPQGADWAEVERQLSRGVRLVCISAVQFQTGLRVPLLELADLCDRWGAELCVDGIQACGAVPLPLDRIHYLASGGHKWMMAVEGAGFMYVRRDKLSQLRPQTAGWLSLTEPLDFLFKPTASLGYHRALRHETSAFEGGAQASLCYAALGAAVALLSSVRDHEGREGVAAIYHHVNRLNTQLEEGLKALGFKSLRSPDSARRSGILSLIPSEELGGAEAIPELVARWSAEGFVCATPHACLRVSPHWYNSARQVELALKIARDHSR